jgi:hypothetical protein
MRIFSTSFRAPNIHLHTPESKCSRCHYKSSHSHIMSVPPISANQSRR